MKALYVLHRVCHYLMMWLFILAGLVTAGAVFYVSFLGYSKYSFEQSSAYGYTFALVAIVLAVAAVVFLMLSHIFKEAAILRARKAEEDECVCDCGCKCGCHECAEAKTELDQQVDEIMKWKNLYVEGIITEREFIDKRNEILRLSK